MQCNSMQQKEKNGSFAQQIDRSHIEIDKEARQKIIHRVWFNLYTVQKQAKLNYIL